MELHIADSRRFFTRLGGFVLILVIAVSLLLNSIHSLKPTPLQAEHVTTITVKSGDSLWSLAERYLPEVDRRQSVRELIQLNQLNGDGDIRSGQILFLPSQGESQKASRP